MRGSCGIWIFERGVNSRPAAARNVSGPSPALRHGRGAQPHVPSDFLLGIGTSPLVEARPASFEIGIPPRDRIDAAILLQNRLCLQRERVFDPNGNQRAAATNAFRVEMGVLLGNAVADHGADQAATDT